MTKRLAFMLAVALGACAGPGSGRVEYAAAVTVRSPELVALGPDVYVLADADEPVFFTDNYYWLYRNNRWYRSRSYDRDWLIVSNPSPRLRHINQPTAYIRYQMRTQEARNTPTPMPQREPWRDDQPRTDVPKNLPPHAQPPQPIEPPQAPAPYPQPPQQEPPVPEVRNDLRVPEDGTYERAPGAPAVPPGQVKDDIPQEPPAQAREDEPSTRPPTPPGQIEKTQDEKAKAKDEETDKKRDY